MLHFGSRGFAPGFFLILNGHRDNSIMSPIMKSMTFALVLSGAVLFGTAAMAIEEAEYTVLKQDGAFELRRYAPKVVAQTVMQGDFSRAGKAGFRRLAGYIFGGNKGTKKISMTAPVNMEPAGQKLATTLTTSQSLAQEGSAKNWRITFVMPSSYTLNTLPEPINQEVVLRQEPAIEMAAIRFSGRWGQERFRKHEEKLKEWIGKQDLITAGTPVFARYDSPLTPWFLRRNEVLIPVKSKK